MTLSNAPASLLDIVASQGCLADLQSLSPAQKADLFKKLGIVVMLENAPYKTKGGIVAAQARLLNVGKSTIHHWLKTYHTHGIPGLIDARKSTAARRALLPEVTKAWIRDQILNCQRRDAIAEVHRMVITQWNQWRRTGDPQWAIPGFSSPPPDNGKGFPAGFSVENFQKCRPTQYAKTLASVGTIASYRQLPSILSTSIGTEYLEYVFFDDEKPDVNVRVLGYDRPMVPLCFHALDRLTRYPFPPHIRLRYYDVDTHTHKHLTQKEFVWYVITLLTTEGYRTDARGTTYIQEHGTAKVWANKTLVTPDGHHSFEDALRALTARNGNPGVRIDSSGLFNKPAFQELIYGPKSSGNPRFKAPIESSFRLWRVYSQHLRGQTGRNIENAPEENHGITQYETRLLKAAADLPDHFRENLISNFLTGVEFAHSAELIRQALANREDHNFEGWAENNFVELAWRFNADPIGLWRPRQELTELAITAPHIHELALREQRANPLLTRIIPWTPHLAREARRRDPAITRLPLSHAIHLVPTDWATEAKFNDRNFIQLTEPLLPGMDLQYLPELTTPKGRTEYLHKGDQVRVLLNPLMPDTLLTYDQSNTFIGTLTRNVPLGRDSNQVDQLFAQRGRIKQAYDAPVRRAKTQEADRRNIIRELNTDLLNRASSTPANPLQTTPHNPRKNNSPGHQADEALANITPTKDPIHTDDLDF